MIENNIFNYATSELSQDAILFYILNFANDNSEKGRLAREFLKVFECDKINENNYSEFEIYSYKQFEKIDVLLLFANKKNKKDSFLLVVEDKVNSEESKEDQLNSYIKKIKDIPVEDINLKKIDNKDEILSNIKIIPIYFKTGAMTTVEKNELMENGNKIITLEDIYSIIKKYKNIDDLIIRQWIEKNKYSRENLKDIQDCIENNITIEELRKLCDKSKINNELDVEKAIVAMNEIGKYMFGDENKINKFHKFYGDNIVYGYNTENGNAYGNPEVRLPMKQDYLYKKLEDKEYYELNPEHQLVYSTFLCIKNYELQIIFEILILNEKNNIYIDYGNQKFFKKYNEIKEKYKNEKNNLYGIIERKIKEMAKKDERFKDIYLEKISNSSNLKLASFNQESINKMKISDFKDFVLKMMKELEKVAENFGFEKQW